MNVEITPKKLAGTVAPPSSKSMTHRAILAAALSQGTSTLRNVSISQDIRASGAGSGTLRGCPSLTAGSPVPPCAFFSPLSWPWRGAGSSPAEGG